MKRPEQVTYRDDKSTVTQLERCRQLRSESTDPEQILWLMLRNRQLAGVKFRRQHQFGPYVLDFFCPEGKLAVEADGEQHTSDAGIARDERRTRYLKTRGIRVLRFTNLEILNETEGVMNAILGALAEPGSCAEPTPPSP